MFIFCAICMSSVFDPYLLVNKDFNKQYLADIEKSKTFLNNFLGKIKPDFLIVLWSGLGDLANDSDLQNRKILPYSDIEWFPQYRGVDGHAGELIVATLKWKQVVMMSGRYHFYEYADLPPALAMKLITFPVRVFQALGVSNMIVSNAAGGVNKSFKVGDVMIMESHINMMWSNPLLGPNIEELWVRFPPMGDAYDLRMSLLAKHASTSAQKWIYLALTGPTYETAAEYGMVKNIWADVVGMSTVPEVIAARHANFDSKGAGSENYYNTNRMNILGLSVVTNLWWPEFPVTPSHDEVKAAAKIAMPEVIKTVKWVIKEYSLYLRPYDIDMLSTDNLNDLEKRKLETIKNAMNYYEYKDNTLLPWDAIIEDWFVVFQWNKLWDDYMVIIERAFKEDYFKRMGWTLE